MLDLSTADYWHERHAEMVREGERNMRTQGWQNPGEGETSRSSGRRRRLGARLQALRPVRGIRRWADI